MSARSETKFLPEMVHNRLANSVDMRGVDTLFKIFRAYATRIDVLRLSVVVFVDAPGEKTAVLPSVTAF